MSNLLCNSEAKVNRYGLIFGGQRSKQVTLCTFNLTSGKCKDTKCIGQDKTCTVSADPPVTATPSSTSFTGLMSSSVSTTSLSSTTSDYPVLPSSSE